MVKTAGIILIIVGVIVFLWWIWKFQNKSQYSPSTNQKITLSLNAHTYTMEVAKTNSQRETGLSYRNELCPTCGMIFVFNQETIWPFWMKDTHIPLDMIWLTKTGKITTILTAQPEPGVALYQLKIYKNAIPSTYVLELNAGDAQKLGLTIGSSLTLPYEQL